VIVINSSTLPGRTLCQKEPERHRKSATALLLVALTWSHVCLVRQWSALAQSPGTYLFLHNSPQRPIDHAAASLASAAVALVLWPALLLFQRARRRSPWRGLSVLILVGMAGVAINNIRLELPGNLGALAILSVALLVGLTVLAKGWRSLARITATVLLCLSPFPIWTSLRTIYLCLARPVVYAAPPRSGDVAGSSERPNRGALAHTNTASRVVWVLFDEWDGALTFDGADVAHRLPALADFRATSLDATAAQAPATHTVISVPALLTGRLLADASPADANDLWLRPLDGSGQSRFQQAPNLIRTLSNHGLAAGIAGWSLPYCRLFPNDLAACFSIPSDLNLRQDLGLYDLTVSNLAMAILPENNLRTVIKWMPDTENHRIIYDALTPISERYAADPSLDFVFLHLPIPHLPVIYNRATGEERADLFHADYADNLALVDRTVQRLKAAMVAGGVWDDTTVLLSSDHWFRKARHSPGQLFNRVPFLLKLKGQHSPARYQPRFNTIVTAGLLTAIVDGGVKQPEEAIRWLTEHRQN